jgi:glycosyltransferase involved in cell wall biosynthesis
MTGLMSVVIPAHNESAVIADMLRRLLDTDPEERLEIVVAANGCTDDTAAVAAAVSPRVRVIEIETPSKIAALNAGDDAATAFPRAYVDADVRVTGEAPLAVADALTDSPFIGAPRMEIDVDGASLAVRWQYRVWGLTDYRSSAMVGSGVYVLSEAGRARFGRFPDVIADDMYALRLFTPEERISVGDHVFTIRAPSTLHSFIRRQTRIIAGNDELRDRYRTPAFAVASLDPLFLGPGRRPEQGCAGAWKLGVAGLEPRRIQPGGGPSIGLAKQE